MDATFAAATPPRFTGSFGRFNGIPGAGRAPGAFTRLFTLRSGKDVEARAPRRFVADVVVNFLMRTDPRREVN